MTTAEAFRHPVAFRRMASVSALGRTTVAALLIAGFVYAKITVTLYDDYGTAAMLVAVPALASAAILAGWRWAPFLAPLLATIIAQFEIPALTGYRLHDFRGGSEFVLEIGIGTTAVAIASISGALAGVQNYRKPAAARTTPRWLRPALLVITGAVLGGSLVGVRSFTGAQAQVTPNSLDDLPAIVAANDAFMQKEIRVKQGEVVLRRIDNADNYDHTFDVPAFDLHMPLSGGESGLLMFKADKPGTYLFKCAIPGHDMKGKIIVEPS